MEKRNYVKPILNSEAFLPQTYVAACYIVSCNKAKEGTMHSPTGCGKAENHIIDYNKDTGKFNKMTEINVNAYEGLVKEDQIIEKVYIDINNDGEYQYGTDVRLTSFDNIAIGQQIVWQTLRWMWHSGTVQAAAKPNMS